MTELTYFNWKKFINNDCKLLISWLEEYGFSDTTTIILKIVTLILRGEQQPDVIMTAALDPSSLEDVLSVDSTSMEPIHVPDHIIKLLGYWQHTLPREAVLLGNIYEKLALSRRGQANYYTPKQAIEFIVKHTVEECDIIANPWVKILDPACGCGYFLLHVYDILFKKMVESRESLKLLFPNLDFTDQGIHAHILKHNLWGADIDKTAVAVASLSLALKSSSTTPMNVNIIIYDSLKRLDDLSITEKIRNVWNNHYDYVIGNPPYLSFGLRGTGTLEPHYREYLRHAYIDSAEYKLSYYVLFIQRGIEMLKETGKLGYIIPDSFLLGRYYSKIRRYIVDNTAIKIITYINSNVFSSASTGYSIICILQKNSNIAIRAANMMKIYQVSSLEQLSNTAPVCEYEQSYFSTQPFHRFRIFFDSNLRSIVEKIELNSNALKVYASGHTGIRSLTKQNEIISLDKTGENWHKGLISGRQVNRYEITYNGHLLHIHPELLYKGGWKESIVKQRKILIRQTGDSIIAGIDEHGYYHLNNIHSFILTNNAITLDYLLLILNSRLMAFYYHATSMEYGRPMAQTDIETLELLPVRINDEIIAQASGLALTMADCVSKVSGGTAIDRQRMASFDEYLNQLVYRIYSLTDDEINRIEHYEMSLPKRSHRNRKSTR